MLKEVRSYDVLGNIALAKFSDNVKLADRKKFANKIMNDNRNVKTVLEKTGKFKGRLRKQTTKFLLGENTKEVLYKENGCNFRFNIDKTYFSPRLSNERKEVAGKIKPGSIVLVMFAGVAPFPVVIAKNSKAKKIYSNELNREANKYAQANILLNGLKNRIELAPGDVKKAAVKLNEKKLKFDVIVMPRPQLKDSFLKEAFSLSKKGTLIYYYDFCKENEKDLIVEKIKQEAKKYKKKIKILKVKNAGEIGPYKVRVRVDVKVM